ncbi:disulfide isomerase [Sphaerulina musiva SO2202]|uniref:protein disulfide-isomerase n=1 Tax=Sphaerulina musiva (strain SO2202) TaxID=692275 RepID=M3CQI0_SPHMS|nr:disulfide isomerase [Sphaerulina musiva SO2202]EMF15933.1 disulfide isomerase [Sphaerulina musiva SO2202]
MPRFTQLFTAALAAVSTVSAGSVLDLTPKNFDKEILKSGKPALVEFFAPWCGHCKSLAPIYEELAASFEGAKDKVIIAKVDADEHKELGKKYEISGFPTLKWFDGTGKSKPEDYKSGRDLDSLTAFITEKTGAKAKKAKTAASQVEHLTDSTFIEKIGKDQDALVAFTAPWCGHCKSLAPTWEKLAADFVHDDNVLIAKVDAEAPNAKATAEKFGVKSYPTILYFPAGSTESQPYESGRSEEDLVKFVNEKAGTYRSPGGTLNALAGVIPSLDATVASLSTGGDKAYKELIKQAGKLQGKYAEYYTKVAKKAQDNQGYVEKELTRLTNLISKGSLAPEKLDDLTSRKNILSVFAGKVAGAADSVKEAAESVKAEL